MDKLKKNFKKRISNDGCECCGYDKYKQILTLHHMYPKRNGYQKIQAEKILNSILSDLEENGKKN